MWNFSSLVQVEQKKENELLAFWLKTFYENFLEKLNIRQTIITIFTNLLESDAKELCEKRTEKENEKWKSIKFNSF